MRLVLLYEYASAKTEFLTSL